MDVSRISAPQGRACLAVSTLRVHSGFLLGIGLALMIVGGSGPGFSAQPVDVPVINGNLGPCTADFTVTDGENKAVYDAKIHVTVLYGFMSKRKSDLEIGTNSDGKARIEGLPNKVKKPPLEFTVRSGDMTKSVTNDPAVECHPKFTVVLTRP